MIFFNWGSSEKGICLSVCLSVSNKRQNGRTDFVWNWKLTWPKGRFIKSQKLKVWSENMTLTFIIFWNASTYTENSAKNLVLRLQKKWSFKEQQFDWFQNFSRKDNNDIFIKFRQIWVSFEFTLIIPLSRFLLSFRVLSGCMECLWRLVKLMLVYVWQVWAIIWIEYELCVLLVCFYTLENGGNLDFSR